jgi:hypothetical protein
VQQAIAHKRPTATPKPAIVPARPTRASRQEIAARHPIEAPQRPIVPKPPLVAVQLAPRPEAEAQAEATRVMGATRHSRASAQARRRSTTTIADVRARSPRDIAVRAVKEHAAVAAPEAAVAGVRESDHAKTSAYQARPSLGQEPGKTLTEDSRNAEDTCDRSLSSCLAWRACFG